jgi:hypothetical protein
MVTSNSLNLHDYGLSALAAYSFMEEKEKFHKKNLNTKKNPYILAVVKRKDGGDKELIIIKKTDLTASNQFQAMFNKGPLACIDTSILEVEKFVTKKVKEISRVARNILKYERSSDKFIPFSEIAAHFEEIDGKKEILSNIYAIANRVRFLCGERGMGTLFHEVSEPIEYKPRVLKINLEIKLDESIKLKYNPGMNGRFLALQVKEKLNLNSKKAIVKLVPTNGSYRSHRTHNFDAVQKTFLTFMVTRDNLKLDEEITKANIGNVVIQYN